MRNEHIKPNDIVPVELRIECYERAIEIIESKEIPFQLGSLFTCFLLPCILWDLNSFLDDAPNGMHWNDHVTSNMFPEWNKNIVYNIESNNKGNRNELRIQYLKEAIEQAKLLL